MSDQLISQAAEHIRAGKNSEARQILMQVIKENPRNEEAWLWLAQALPPGEMRVTVLEQCLKFFPQSSAARLELERLAAPQAPSTGPDDPPPAARNLKETPLSPAQAATGDLPPVPRFKLEEPAQSEPPAPQEQPAPAPLELPKYPPEGESSPRSPSVLARLYSPTREAAPTDEQTGSQNVDELREEMTGTPQPFLADEPESSLAETPAAQTEELQEGTKRVRPKSTFRSVLRVLLLVFYGVVLIGGGWTVWQRYGTDITRWFKALPQTVRTLGSPAPTGTPTSAAALLPTPRVSSTSTVIGPKPRAGLGEILFISERSGTPDLYIDHLDGQAPALVIAAGSPSSAISDPAWSADGKQIAFVRGEGQKTDLFTALPDGSGVVVQTNDQAGNAHPSWAPDGDRIVFVSQRDGGEDLYILTTSTGKVQRLTEKTGKNYAPAWSPDGSRIAFVSDRDGYAGLYLINPDGGDLLPLSGETQSISNPAWSQDSQWIAFASTTKNDRLLYAISRDGATMNRITFSPGKDDHPAWSPDGAWIVFSSERGHPGKPTLYMERSDGKGMYLFDTEANLDRNPVWSSLIK